MPDTSAASRPTFYQLLQLGVADLKNRAKEVDDVKERRRTVRALLVRDLLVVAFAVAYITLFTTLFGMENSAPAVATFVMLIALRYVGYNFRLADDVKVLVMLFVIFLLAPLLGANAGPWIRLLLNVVCLGAIMVLTTDNPHLGNGGMYGFAYCFMTGSMYGQPIPDDRLPWRVAALALGFAICVFVRWRGVKRTADVPTRRIRDALREYSMFTPKGAYQMRAALGISLALFIGDLMGLPRLMWVGLVASSMLTPYGLQVKDRLWGRVLFVALGTALFYFAYPLIPEGYQGLIGIVAGIGTGLCATYHWGQVFNTMGAMALGVTYYSLDVASVARVGDNVIGAILALVVSVAFAALMAWVPLREEKDEAEEEEAARVARGGSSASE